MRRLEKKSKAKNEVQMTSYPIAYGGQFCSTNISTMVWSEGGYSHTMRSFSLTLVALDDNSRIRRHSSQLSFWLRQFLHQRPEAH